MPTAVELLEPESWGNVLELYARTVGLAVAFVDPEGRLIGRCHNPKPIWTLARAARPDWGTACPFCLNANGACTAAVDAERTGVMTVATDSGGFVHVAIPLVLDTRHLATLLAGQCFDHYPEPLSLDRVAKTFGISAQRLWTLARRRIPVSRANLITYGNLLGTLSHAFLQERYSKILQRELANLNGELRSSNRSLSEANAKLAQNVEQLADAAEEKDVLLSEVHHRVNNNLAVIASLLRMQAGAFPDDQVARALRASQLRVDSMALIHAQLYKSGDWRAVDFSAYAAELSGNLFRSYGVDGTRITLRLEIDPFNLSVEQAIPAGLILNELISNALKHAFPGARSGSILIQGSLREGRIELSVADDGAGRCQPARAGTRQSLGLKIVDILCHQLKGTLMQPGQEDTRDGGCIFRISFPYATRSRSAEG